MRKGWKRIHRLVVLPDYQGIGIGMKFINEVSDIVKNDGFKVNLTTTTPSLINAMCIDKKWLLKRFGRTGNDSKNWAKYGTGKKKQNIKLSKLLGKTASKNRITYSFDFK